MNLVRQNPTPRSVNRRTGFTLLELLVVITLLLLLAGTLTASVGKAQARVRTVSCLSNLRQWGLATHQHCLDHDDRLPPDGAPNGISLDAAWYVDLPLALGIAPYPKAGPWRTNPAALLPKSPWLCPSNPRRSNGNLLFHYTLNRRVNGSGPDSHPQSLGSIPVPSETVWLFDNGKLAAVAAEGNAHTNAHHGGADFLFLDGHARRLGNADYWDFRRNRPRTNTPSVRWFP